MAATPPVRLDKWKRKNPKGKRGSCTTRFSMGTAGGKGTGGGGVTCISSMVWLAIWPDDRPGATAICPEGRLGTAAIWPDDRLLATGLEAEGRAGGVATSSMSESSPVRAAGPGSTRESTSWPASAPGA